MPANEQNTAQTEIEEPQERDEDRELHLELLAEMRLG